MTLTNCLKDGETTGAKIFIAVVAILSLLVFSPGFYLGPVLLVCVALSACIPQCWETDEYRLFV